MHAKNLNFRLYATFSHVLDLIETKLIEAHSLLKNAGKKTMKCSFKIKLHKVFVFFATNRLKY